MTQLKNGQLLSDEQIVVMIMKRISLSDCQKKGWVLDGLPQNKKQAELFDAEGVVPLAVFSLQLSDLEVKMRLIKAKSDIYEFDMQVAH